METIDIKDIQELVLDVSTDLIYLADMDTYEIFYINTTLLDLLDNPKEEEWRKIPCYELFQGRKSPCEFCTNSILKTDNPSFWTQYNPKFQSWITYKDKKIVHKGRNLRLEVARDISENVEINEILHDLMEEKRILVDCVGLLESQTPPHIAMQKLLKLIANFHKADRAYILDFDVNTKLAKHSFEYCSEGVKSQVGLLHGINLTSFTPFLRAFEKKLPFRIKDINTDQEMLNDPICQAELIKYNIKSLLIAPIFSHDGKVVGILGVDNPTVRLYAQSVIGPLSTFISDCFERQKFTEKLFNLSYSDGMTNLKNSHAFLEEHAKIEENYPKTLGIAYIDINGLKQINDSLGHEAGNELIIQLAHFLYEVFPENSYRVGGDEFVILASDFEENVFNTAIDEIRGKIEKVQNLHVAIGTAWTNNFSEGIKKFIEIADRAMYQNKKEFYSSKGFDRRRPR